MKGLISALGLLVFFSPVFANPTPKDFEGKIPVETYSRGVVISDSKIYLGDTEFWDFDWDGKIDYKTYRNNCTDISLRKPILEIYDVENGVLFMYDFNGVLNRTLNKKQIEQLPLPPHIMHTLDCPKTEVAFR